MFKTCAKLVKNSRTIKTLPPQKMRPKVNFKPEAWVKLSELKPHPKNPRVDLRLDEGKFSSLKKSIEEGVFEPVKISKKTGYCLAGNQRLKAFEDLGFDEVPVMFNECENEHEEMQVLLKDNNEWGAYDFGVLAGLVAEMDLDISNMGFSEDDLKQLSKEDKQRDKDMIEDDVPAVPEEPKAKLGDIYQLGRHRLMCGDSTSIEAVAKLMNGQKADMVFTDPPYFITGTSTGLSIDVTDDGMIRPFFDAISSSVQALLNVEKGCAYVCCDWRTYPAIARSFSNKFSIKNVLCWVKNNAGMGYSWMNKYENIIFLEPKVLGQKMSTKKTGRPIKAANVLNFDRVDHTEKSHNAQKPIDLIEYVLEKTAESSEIYSVADLFGGSGSTLIACEKTGRACFAMELEPKYIDVIVQRWEEYTGEKALKIA